MGRRIFDSAFFDFRDAARDSDHDARTNHAAAVVNLADEVAKHGFRDLEVGNNTVFEWADGNNVTWGTPKHALRLVTNSQNTVGALLNGNHRRFT